jgi:hypothetical protein
MRGHSVHLILCCRITSIFHTRTAPCLRNQHRLHDSTYHISGTWSSHPLAQSVLHRTSSHKIRVACFHHCLRSWRSGKTPLTLGAQHCFFLGIDFALPSFPSFSFLLVIVCLKYDSEVACLVSCLFRHFFADIFFCGVGIIILKVWYHYLVTSRTPFGVKIFELTLLKGNPVSSILNIKCGLLRVLISVHRITYRSKLLSTAL